MLSRLRSVPPSIRIYLRAGYQNISGTENVHSQFTKTLASTDERGSSRDKEALGIGVPTMDDQIMDELITTPRAVPMVLESKEPTMLSFDDVPGPKILKYLALGREYLSVIGTQITAKILTTGINWGATLSSTKPYRSMSYLFDEYGPVVRFIGPLGGDIVLLNHPDHIQKVFSLEGEFPVRSSLDSLEKYRIKYRNYQYNGPYSIYGQEWNRQRSLFYRPLQNTVSRHALDIEASCDIFVRKMDALRNRQDEVGTDLYKELHKWAFDCMGFVIFSKNLAIMEAEVINSQCDATWLYNSLVNATNAIMKCEKGLQLWKFFDTPAWLSLVDNCDALESLIGKHVRDIEQKMMVSLSDKQEATESQTDLSIPLIKSILMGENMRAEDAATILMDMLIIGVNTTASAISFLLYNLARSQKSQKILHREIVNLSPQLDLLKTKSVKENTPYLQACIKETLRLVPPIPVLTRILSKNIILDKYNIPRGTLIIMSTQDSSLKESNYDDALKFYPERWLKSDAREYHTFASIPFGFGARKCLGQGIAETTLSLITIKLLRKYKLEYHYGDIVPTKSFIARPNKALKLRFIDRD